eukprot:Blabericola_migrator_1__6534@NODE_3296_length_1880_cov_45_036404_g2059_i0_p1_GENE_NODE_3296_length_1880_cov_45_036404_g2059_i0NODE_3296_length_1880_cov_45_036404_g2059_i0_p1_ORF_typecomplete_len141_score7_80_NODE_3296_length_1880_cov_45_036404_g2059_i0483905
MRAQKKKSRCSFLKRQRCLIGYLPEKANHKLIEKGASLIGSVLPLRKRRGHFHSTYPVPSSKFKETCSRKFLRLCFEAGGGERLLFTVCRLPNPLPAAHKKFLPFVEYRERTLLFSAVLERSTDWCGFTLNICLRVETAV